MWRCPEGVIPNLFRDLIRNFLDAETKFILNLFQYSAWQKGRILYDKKGEFCGVTKHPLSMP